MAISESTRLLAPGAGVVLADGKTYALKFTWRAVQAIEKDLGGLDAAVEILTADGWKNERVTAIGKLMGAALLHTKMKPEEVLDLLDFKQVVTYLIALNEAFMQAVPVADEGEAGLPNAVGSADSPGNGSFDSPSLIVPLAPASSGT